MAKKDFGRRLMPEYLLKYSEELQKNHPDPSASWGGGSGGDYTAGEGIDITGDVISIDEEVVAKKTDIPTVPSVLSAFTNDVGYITGITSSDVTTALGYVPGTSNFSGDYEDLSGKPTIPTVDYPVTDVQVDGVSVVSNKVASITMPDVSHDLTYVDISYDSDHSTYNWPDSDTTAEIISKPYKYAFHIVDKTSWSALTYPSQHYMAFYDTTYFRPTTGNMCYIWRGVFACASAKYPYIAVLDYEVNVGWSLRYEEVKIQWKDVDYKPTFASVATSGNYNDLSDKPTIPTDTSDLTNGAGYITSSALSNYVTTNTEQDITGAKVFKGSYKITCQSTTNEGASVAFKASSQSSSAYPIGVMEIDEKLKVLKVGVNTTQGPGYKVGFQSYGNRTYTAYLPDNVDKFASIGSGNVYLPLSVNGNKASVGGNITLSATSTVTPTTETLVFTLDDDSTVTVNVMTEASVTTTLS